MDPVRKLSLNFLKIYQRFFTLVGYGSCRYYPTCSEYAKWQFEKNTLFKAFLFSFLRVLRCNQLFSGGIDYPLVKKKINCKKLYTYNKNANTFIVKFWFIPKGNNKFYLIKSLKKKENIDR